MSIKQKATCKYTDDLAAHICGEMAEGRSLKSICADAEMPNIATVFRWLADDRYVSFRDNYARAMDMRAQAMFEDMIDAASERLTDEFVTITEKDDGSIVRSTQIMDNVRRSDLKARSIQWALARMSPKKYGDKMQVESKVDITQHYNEDDNAILDRLARERAAKTSKPKPQEGKNA